MSPEHSSEPGEGTFRSPLEEPGVQSPEAAVPNQGEQKLSFAHRFTETSAEVPEAESQQATSDFRAMVEEFMLHHAGEVKVHEMVDGYPTSHVDRKMNLKDGSDVRVSVVTRGEGIPKEIRGGLPGAPMEVFVRTFKDEAPGRQLFYRFDGEPPVVRREEHNDPMGNISRALEAVEGAEAESGGDGLMAALGTALGPEGGARATESDPIAQHIANERANQKLQEEMGVNNRKIGLREVGGLKQLLAEFS